MKKFYSLMILVTVFALLGAQGIVRADSPVTPFVDSQTNAVIYVDFSTLDLDQVNAWQQKALDGITDPAVKAKQQEQAKKGIDSAKKWVGDFKAAGGKDLYIVVSLAGLMQGAPGGIIIPLNGADPAALGKVINPQGNPPPADPNDPNAAQMSRMQPQTAVVGQDLVFSTGSGIQKLKTPSTEPRQDLTDALASGTGSTLHIALTPATLKGNPIFGAMMNSRMAGGTPGAAPKPPFSDPQWDAVTWMSVSLTAPPKSSGNCTIQCKDADSATALSDLLTKQMQDAKDDATKRGNVSADDLNKLMTAAKPAVSGTQVVISLDQDTIDNVLGPILTKSMQHGGQGNAPPPPADNSGM